MPPSTLRSLPPVNGCSLTVNIHLFSKNFTRAYDADHVLSTRYLTCSHHLARDLGGVDE